MSLSIAYELSLVSTTEIVPVGTTFTRPHPTAGYGLQTWVFVKNVEASASFTNGCAVVRKAGTLQKHGILAASGTVYPRTRAFGFAQHTIPAASFGWILAQGMGSILTGTADITADVPITTGGSSAGAVIDYADGATTREAVIGWATTASATNDAVMIGKADCPFI